ncbi:hypothetical protein ACHAXA_010283 [Cyclostephanos tholiformis]|uniref:Uncharacterized protein n=1 Tax=Cyclostephanos tholiformis TaxID=382380 RepID=A0ABD3RDF1_9STRA
MSDTLSQLAEVNGLIAADPDDPTLRQLREDLLQLIALEEQESAEHRQEPPLESTDVEPPFLGMGKAGTPVEEIQHGDSATVDKTSSFYTAQGKFMEHIIVSNEAIAEAPDLGSFQPVYSKSHLALKSGDDDAYADHAGLNVKNDATNTNPTKTATTTTNQSAEKKQTKKKHKSDDAMLEAKFELPSHLVPLESDTPAQKLKKQRTAKALKSKFREKQKEAEHSKRQRDWKSFATKAPGGKKRKGGNVGSGSIFSTEEGVNARVGVISGGGGRKMTDFADPNKRHKFT